MIKLPKPEPDVLAAVNAVFKAAQRMPHESALRFHFVNDQADSRPQISLVRELFGFPRGGNTYSLWCTGKTPSGNPGFTDKTTFRLIDMFSGLRLESYCSGDDDAQVREILKYFHDDSERLEKLNYAIDALKLYKAKCFFIAYEASQGKGPTALTTRSESSDPVAQTQAYVGIQAALGDPQTKAILDQVRSGNSLLGGSLRCLIDPYVGEEAYVRHQKYMLYGGVPDRSAKLNSLEVVALGISFPRSVSDKLYSAIVESQKPFTSHLLVGLPGQGKSIALAQIVWRLSHTPGIWTFWSLDRTLSLEVQHSGQHEPDRQVQHYLSSFKQCGAVPKRLVFVVDDLSERTPAELKDLVEFRRWCRHYSSEMAVSFLMASKSLDYFREERVSLELTKDDEDGLYRAITKDEPIIAKPAYSSLDDVPSIYEAKQRYKDDVQSLSDFVIRNSDPVIEIENNWFSDLNKEPDLTQRALPYIAVSQLLDLPIPRRIAHLIAASSEDESGSFEVVDLAVSRRISRWREDEQESRAPWNGYELRAPYYARSLLIRLKKLNVGFIKEALDCILRHSLRRAETALPSWFVAEAEYVRHVFHRLSRKKYGRLGADADGALIADELFELYGRNMVVLLRDSGRVEHFARWAGTLSSLNAFPKAKRDKLSDDPESIERIVYDLCENVFKKFRSVEKSQDFVQLMRAVRELCNAFPDDPQVLDLANMARRSAQLDQILILALNKSDPQWERRANEVIDSYREFLKVMSTRWKIDVRKEVLDVYQCAETSPKHDRFRFDARNALSRASFVSTHNDSGIELCARYLRDARQIIQEQVREQARFRKDVERAIGIFERKVRKSIDILPKSRGD